MSSSTACDSGTSAAPNSALQQRGTARSASSDCAVPHSAEATREADDRDQEHALAPEAVGEPAGQRRHDRGGDDVGGQHPGDLILRRRQAALHVRQRDVGDRGVERLHDRRQHDGHGDHAAVAPRHPAPAAAAHVCDASALGATARGGAAEQTGAGARCRPRRSALSPACSAHAVDSRARACRRTGNRCTTLTQLPVAFSAGSSENCAPVPGLSAGDTCALKPASRIGVDAHRRPAGRDACRSARFP